jgi:hypothetical protein
MKDALQHCRLSPRTAKTNKGRKQLQKREDVRIGQAVRAQHLEPAQRWFRTRCTALMRVPDSTSLLNTTRQIAQKKKKNREVNATHVSQMNASSSYHVRRGRKQLDFAARMAAKRAPTMQAALITHTK